MSSIFSHYNSRAELPSQGISKYRYEQIAASRDLQGSLFSNGMISYTFDIAGNEHWIPARSYFRMKYTLGKGDAAGGTQLALADNIAPSMNLIPNLFNSGKVKINGKEVSYVSANFGEIDALENRMSKTSDWFKTIGKDSNHWSPEFADRLNDVCSDGFRKERVSVSSMDTVRAILGFDAATTTVEHDGANTMTFDAGAIPALGPIFSPGDQIITVGGTYTVADIPTAVTITTVEAGPAHNASNGIITRRRTFSVGSDETRRSRQIESIWQPSFSIFKINKALPTGQYRIELVPFEYTQMQRRAVQSTLANGNPYSNGGTDFAFVPSELYFYACTCVGPRVTDTQIVLDLDRTVADVKDITNGNTQMTYDVAQTTYAITAAVQSSLSGIDSRYNVSKFQTAAGMELGLTRLQISYAGQDQPSVLGQPEYNPTTQTDYYQQLYQNTMLYTGRYFQSGESYDDWLLRNGPYVFQPFFKDGSDKSTTATVRFTFRNYTANDAKLLVFHHYKRSATLTIKDGIVQSVTVRDE